MPDPTPRLLITAGPTHEPIDAVRYIANRSSGRLGAAMAAAGREAGWDVTLLLGPAEVPPPVGVAVHRFTTAADLERLLEEWFPRCDALIMAAAVADYRPRPQPEPKLARTDRGMTLELEPTPDLVAACAACKRQDQRIVGFALEPAGRLKERSGEKLRSKGLDAIVANPLETMGSETIAAQVLYADGRRLDPGPMPKLAFARWLIREVVGTLRPAH